MGQTKLCSDATGEDRKSIRLAWRLYRRAEPTPSPPGATASSEGRVLATFEDPRALQNIRRRAPMPAPDNAHKGDSSSGKPLPAEGCAAYATATARNRQAARFGSRAGSRQQPWRSFTVELRRHGRCSRAASYRNRLCTSGQAKRSISTRRQATGRRQADNRPWLAHKVARGSTSAATATPSSRDDRVPGEMTS